MTQQEYKIATLADILALTPDQRIRCVADLQGWVKAVNTLGPDSILKAVEYVHWIDDGLLPGTISSVRIKVTP